MTLFSLWNIFNFHNCSLYSLMLLMFPDSSHQPPPLCRHSPFFDLFSLLSTLLSLLSHLFFHPPLPSFPSSQKLNQSVPYYTKPYPVSTTCCTDFRHTSSTFPSTQPTTKPPPPREEYVYLYVHSCCANVSARTFAYGPGICHFICVQERTW